MADWVRLGDVCTISGINEQLNFSEEYWLLNLDMVEKQTGRILSYQYVSAEALEGSIIGFDTNNVLYSKLRPNLNKVVLPDCCGYATSEMVPLKPDAKVLSREYLAEYLRSDVFVKWAISKTTGAKMPRLGKKELLNKKIPLPSLSEQKKISALLKKISDLIGWRQQQLVNLDELVKSRFIEMFGDPIRNTQNRPTTDFINVVKMQRGFDLPVQDRQQDGNIPVFGSNGALARHNVAKVQGGGVITGRSGTIGKVYYTEGDYWPLNTSLFSVDTHGNNIIYLAYLLKMYDLSRFTEGTGVPTLNRNKFHNEPIIDVSLLEQETFAAFVKQVDKSKLVVQKSLEQLEILKKALMQEYFG